MKSLYAVFFLLAAAVGCSAQAACSRDKDCDPFQYCKLSTSKCVIRLDTGSRCMRDNMCASNKCKSDGTCKSLTRRIAGGIIAAIAIAAVVMLLICIGVIFCCCRVFKKRGGGGAQA